MIISGICLLRELPVRYQPGSCNTPPYVICLSRTRGVLASLLNAGSTSTRLALSLSYSYMPPIPSCLPCMLRFDPAPQTPEFLLIPSILHLILVWNKPFLDQETHGGPASLFLAIDGDFYRGLVVVYTCLVSALVVTETAVNVSLRQEGVTMLSLAKRIRETVTPARRTSAFLTRGVLTPEEFVEAGEQLVFKCPTWTW